MIAIFGIARGKEPGKEVFVQPQRTSAFQKINADGTTSVDSCSACAKYFWHILYQKNQGERVCYMTNRADMLRQRWLMYRKEH